MLVVDDFDRNGDTAAEVMEFDLRTPPSSVWMSTAEGLQVMRSFLC
jgi:hypothetical protein